MEDGEKSTLITAVCMAIQQEQMHHAPSLLRHEYPFSTPKRGHRTYTTGEATRLFVRDGFIDRYCGQRLIFTPVLRLLSRLFPDDFPLHPN